MISRSYWLFYLFVFIGIVAMNYGCSEEKERYVPLGNKISQPSAIATDGEWFYVVNSDIERRHNAGSIVTINQKGEKKGVILTPRLGRFIVVRKPYIIVGYSSTDQYKTAPQIRIYDARNPTRLKLYQTFSMDCTPINAVAPEKYNYFAVSCEYGEIYVGYFRAASQKSLADISLRYVRNYGPHARRALFIDKNHHHLYSFATDWQRSDFSDRVLLDATSSFLEPVEDPVKGPVDFSGTDSTELRAQSYQLSEPNEVPDDWEGPSLLNESEKHTRRSEYQFAVLDLSKLAKEQFAFAGTLSSKSQSEFRWLYFRTSDSQVKVPKAHKYYRSNFWQITNVPGSTSSFFISQRGQQSKTVNPDSNAIYLFELIGSPAPSTDGKIPKTSSFLRVTKSWGHPHHRRLRARRTISNQRDRTYLNSTIRFTGNFIRGVAHGRPYFLINDFRDPAMFADQPYYSLTLSALVNNRSDKNIHDLLVFTDRGRSYFAIAATHSVALAGTFFNRMVSLFSITPDFQLKHIKDIH
ncbi:MAG: hypothetical protein OXC40_02330 [Proteobacteria bacterium]|nr:hypothetical protein [Pseudomonadota bacterium]